MVKKAMSLQMYSGDVATEYFQRMGKTLRGYKDFDNTTDRAISHHEEKRRGSIFDQSGKKVKFLVLNIPNYYVMTDKTLFLYTTNEDLSYNTQKIRAPKGFVWGVDDQNFIKIIRLSDGKEYRLIKDELRDLISHLDSIVDNFDMNIIPHKCHCGAH